MHHVIERAALKSDIVEERIFYEGPETNHWKLSGQIDLLQADGSLIDFKVTSAWTAMDALQNNKIECIDITEMYSLKFSYEELNLVMKILKNYNANIINHKNDIISEIKCSITLQNSKNFYDKISENHKIDIKYLKTK